ncbi:mitochondrial genome maintenance MGM101 [Xylariaceae sp. FL0016]|nr:mitochondrial genome maintenance MGM101 [Xylariaceae sp. FL0016]
MASRTMTPLRAAGKSIQMCSRGNIIPRAAKRGLVSASKAKPYPQTSTATASKPASATQIRSTTAAKPSATPASSTTPKAPTSTPASSSPSIVRTPVPPVSGQPLPSAAEATAPNGDAIDWTNSYHGIGTSAFPNEVATVLQAPLDPDDIEVKPDGIIYLPEIKYRRILNAAFGPGGWGLAPRGDLSVADRLVTREYALVVHGRFVAQARGEQQYFSEDGVPKAAEGCKSNALMRCCKDLGIASELWDPRFIRKFMKSHAMQQWVEHVTTKKKKQIWLRKDDDVRYPFKKTA